MHAKYYLRVKKSINNRFSIGKVYRTISVSNPRIIDDQGKYTNVSIENEKYWLAVPYDQADLVSLLHAQYVHTGLSAYTFAEYAKDRCQVIVNEICTGKTAHMETLVYDSVDEGYISTLDAHNIITTYKSAISDFYAGALGQPYQTLAEDHQNINRKPVIGRIAHPKKCAYPNLTGDCKNSILNPETLTITTERLSIMKQKLQSANQKLVIEQQWQINGTPATEYTADSLLDMATLERERANYLKGLGFESSRAVTNQIATHEHNVANLLQLMEDRLPAEDHKLSFVITGSDILARIMAKRAEFFNSQNTADGPDNFKSEKEISELEFTPRMTKTFEFYNGEMPSDEEGAVLYKQKLESFLNGARIGIAAYLNLTFTS